jgi:hypothetical protein
MTVCGSSDKAVVLDSGGDGQQQGSDEAVATKMVFKRVVTIFEEADPPISADVQVDIGNNDDGRRTASLASEWAM